MMLAWLLALPTAFAEEAPRFRFGLSGGVETVTNDPFVRRLGARLGASISPAPWMEFGTSFIFFPIFGGDPASSFDWKPAAKQLLVENSVSPDISLMDWEGQAVVRVRAISYKPGNLTMAFGVLGGAAMIHTVDNAQALQTDVSDPYFAATQKQVHVGPVGGLYWDALSGSVGLRVRVENVGYIETINSTTLEMKNNLLIGAEMLKWF